MTGWIKINDWLDILKDGFIDGWSKNQNTWIHADFDDNKDDYNYNARDNDNSGAFNGDKNNDNDNETGTGRKRRYYEKQRKENK